MFRNVLMCTYFERKFDDFPLQRVDRYPYDDDRTVYDEQASNHQQQLSVL